MKSEKRKRNLFFMAGCIFVVNFIITLSTYQYILVPILLSLASSCNFVAAYKAD